MCFDQTESSRRARQTLAITIPRNQSICKTIFVLACCASHDSPERKSMVTFEGPFLHIISLIMSLCFEILVAIVIVYCCEPR